MKFFRVAVVLAVAACTAYSAPVEEGADHLLREVVEYFPDEGHNLELENDHVELEENDIQLLENLINNLKNEDHDLENEDVDEDEFEVEEVGSRQPRVTCDLLSVQIPKVGKVNHAACAANCLTMGKAGGRCNNGVCQCRKTTIADLWDKRFG